MLANWLSAAVLTAILGLGSAAAAADPQLQWIGHAAFKITTSSGKVILIDPFILKNPKAPRALKDLNALGKVDVILITHGHGDHVGDAPKLAKMHQAKIWMPAGLGSSFATLGVVPKDLAGRFNKSGTVTPFDGVKITMVRAEHSSEFGWKNPITGKTQVYPGGEPAGYVITLENGVKVYHMGDTGLFGDMELIRDRYAPDVILIPIGGHFVMDPEDAAYATNRLLRPRKAVPMHYGTIPVLKGKPEDYKARVDSTQTQVIVMQPGDTISLKK